MFLGKVRKVLEAADQVLSKMLGDWTGFYTPQTVMTTKAPAVLKKKKQEIFNPKANISTSANQ